ncbi:hypothetical protein MAM1_0023d01930 [Mucor ambiguus]|uniref:Uncharacterized protein n=1 Tax=Mucor ambiguus TaxID=91626 RepID=A0A0C9M1U4_9FUNG|nr:hypothetical protein MAM1_0023d01930 [Mucor ambiguus]
MSDTLLKRSPPDDFDWPATIFLYVVLILMGVGMCFCLKRANRLIPNRFSFPLVDRGTRGDRGFHDLGAEEEGLLSHYSDVEDEDDAQVIDNQNALGISRQSDDEDDDAEDFGQLQSHDAIGTDSDDDTTGSTSKATPYKDDEHPNPQ